MDGRDVAPELLALGDRGIVGTAAVVDDADLGVTLGGVPDTLGELEVGEVGAVGALLSLCGRVVLLGMCVFTAEGITTTLLLKRPA